MVGVWQKDRAGLNDQEMSGLSLRVYYYCIPGEYMPDTTYMYHPLVGLHAGSIYQTWIIKLQTLFQQKAGAVVQR